jgi:saccharopine dehydrogenase (NAD+, L-lysine-forming)
MLITLTTPFLLCGSYSYTGSLIADLAVRRGMYPFLSGGDPVRLKVQADKLGLEYRSTSLADQATLKAVENGVRL